MAIFQAREGVWLYPLGNVGLQASKGLNWIPVLYNGHSGCCVWGGARSERQGWLKADQLGARSEVGDAGERGDTRWNESAWIPNRFQE